MTDSNSQKWCVDLFLGCVERYADAAALFDLQEGTYRIIAAGAGFIDAPEGTIQSIYEGSLERVMPECRDDYAKNMRTEVIKERLSQADQFRYQAFFQNPDGTVSSKISAYYVIDDERRFALAMRMDITDAYEQEQAIAKAREAVASSSVPSSAFIEDLISRQDQRKTVLVVEDSEINREIVTEVLSSEFNVLCAEDGEKGIQVLTDHVDEVDLVLLDVYMPVCDGFEFLERTRKSSALAAIPVVVATGSNHREDEERCLRLGATDFVTKPYDPDRLMARIKGAIRMTASASTISAFEFDPLTGLFTFPAFVFHANRMLSKDDPGVFALVDIRDLGTLNSVHGNRACDDVLRFLGSQLEHLLPDALISRSGGRFYVFSPQPLPGLSELLVDFAAEAKIVAPVPNIRMRIGMCQATDDRVPAATLCDRAKMATESISLDSSNCLAIYDDGLERQKARDLKMLADFDDAIAQRQFVAWVQPKVDSATGGVEAGEALVRWFDGEGKFVSPGDFIPLFEREGCIKDLDEYIFRVVCEYQRSRMDAGKRVVPISVNLSRASLFGGRVSQLYGSIADAAGVPRDLVPLEITESAATSNNNMASICHSFVDAGFSLHMDDFGAGYSSLSSLAELPFDMLKLDKSLIDRIGTKKGDIVIKNAIEIARDLGMKVVAEGAEEQSQVDRLAELDCRLIQGYYYAAPMKTDAFSELLDKESPFSEKVAKIELQNRFPVMSQADFSRYLKVARGTHELVRVLDFEHVSYCIVDDTGALEQCAGMCYDVWGRHTQCENCTSRMVLQSHGSAHKFEVLNGEAFIVYSKYMEVDGEPRVVELIDNVGSGPLHGIGATTSFMDALLTAGGEIYHDVQLGTFNRRYFEEKREDLSSATALAFVDLDGLKALNDSMGHDAGDHLLKTAADAMLKCVRSTDSVIRMGGDEFLLVFAGMKGGMLESKMEYIKQALAKRNVSLSIGGCYCDGVTDEAVQAADRAMYESKRTGEVVLVDNSAELNVADEK